MQDASSRSYHSHFGSTDSFQLLSNHLILTPIDQCRSHLSMKKLLFCSRWRLLAKNVNWPKVQRPRTWGVPFCKREVYNRTLGSSEKGDRKIIRARDQGGRMSSGYDEDVTPMDPQQLRLPAQNLLKTTPVSISAWIQGLTRVTPSYQLEAIYNFWERLKFSSQIPPPYVGHA